MTSDSSGFRAVGQCFVCIRGEEDGSGRRFRGIWASGQQAVKESGCEQGCEIFHLLLE